MSINQGIEGSGLWPAAQMDRLECKDRNSSRKKQVSRQPQVSLTGASPFLLSVILEVHGEAHDISYCYVEWPGVFTDSAAQTAVKG
jgi:hypothetical protein